MRHKTLLPALALMLVGADGPDAPSESETTPADSPPQDGAPTDETFEPAPVEAAATAPTGDQVLAEATSKLRQRDWEGALDLAIPAIATYPDLAASFQAIAQLATDQIARGPQFTPPGGHGSAPVSGSSERPLAVPVDGQQPTNPSDPSADPYYGWRSPRWRDDRPHPAADDPREGILFGFDAGLNNGLRVEWKVKGRTVDGVGLQAGLGTWVYGGLYLAPTTQVYMDFQSRSDFQFETSLGILWASGSAYPLVGIGAQWDPPKPIHINAGVDVGLGVFPDVSVGFLW